MSEPNIQPSFNDSNQNNSKAFTGLLVPLNLKSKRGKNNEKIKASIAEDPNFNSTVSNLWNELSRQNNIIRNLNWNSQSDILSERPWQWTTRADHGNKGGNNDGSQNGDDMQFNILHYDNKAETQEQMNLLVAIPKIEEIKIETRLSEGNNQVEMEGDKEEEDGMLIEEIQEVNFDDSHEKKSKVNTKNNSYFIGQGDNVMDWEVERKRLDSQRVNRKEVERKELNDQRQKEAIKENERKRKEQEQREIESERKRKEQEQKEREREREEQEQREREEQEQREREEQEQREREEQEQREREEQEQREREEQEQREREEQEQEEWEKILNQQEEWQALEKNENEDEDEDAQHKLKTTKKEEEPENTENEIKSFEEEINKNVNNISDYSMKSQSEKPPSKSTDKNNDNADSNNENNQSREDNKTAQPPSQEIANKNSNSIPQDHEEAQIVVEDIPELGERDPSNYEEDKDKSESIENNNSNNEDNKPPQNAEDIEARTSQKNTNKKQTASIQKRPKDPNYNTETIWNDKGNALKYNSWSPELKQVVKELIDNVMEFDIDHPDLSNLNEFTQIEEYDFNEKGLPSIIDNFKQNILLEIPPEVNDKNRWAFYSKSYFQGTFIVDKILSSLVINCKVDHITLLNDLHARLGEMFPKNYEEMSENDIFTDDNMNEYYNFRPVFSSWESIKTFTYKYSIYESVKILSTASVIFSYWRECLSDGNSFYRVIMFTLLEKYILTRDIINLTNLIHEIVSDDFMNYYEEKKINYKTAFAIFKIILDNTPTGNHEAYSVFLSAYKLKDNCFDHVLIAYLRKVVYSYCAEINDLIDEYENNKQNNRKKPLNTNKIELESIKEFGCEPPCFVIIWIPYLFPVDLKLYCIYGDFLHPHDKFINLSDQDNNLPVWRIGNFYNSYYPLYLPDDTEKITIDKIVEREKIETTQLTYCPEEEYDCTVCGEKSKKALLWQKKIVTCFTCLSTHVNRVISARADVLMRTLFFGLEYYLQPIHLKDHVYLSNFEVIELFDNKDIVSLVHKKVTSFCVKCKKEFKEDALSILKCKCSYCEECWDNTIEKVTKGHIILNKYEKTTFQIGGCMCGRKFNIDDAIKALNIWDQQLIDNAKKRMYDYVNSLCMSCWEPIFEWQKERLNTEWDEGNEDNRKHEQGEGEAQGQGQKKSKQNAKRKPLMDYKVIKIKQENAERNGIDFWDCDHLMCSKCYVVHKRRIKMDDQDEEVKVNEVQCKICSKRHLLSEAMAWNADNDACCGGGCIII